MKEKRPIFDTIVDLLKLKRSATFSEVSSFSGYSKPHVLKVLALNKPLMKIEKGKIVAVRRVDADDAIKKAKKEEKFYWRDRINYGAATALRFTEGVCPEADALREPYTCGGLGDSYTLNVVLDTPQNESALVDLGYEEIDRINPLKRLSGCIEWREEVE